MNRPAPRKSGLVGTSPLTPPSPVAGVPAVEPPAPAAEAAPQVAPAAVSAPTVRSADKYPRLNYYVEDGGTRDRIRAAFLAGRSQYGWRTFSEMQAAGVLALVAQLEQELNGGAQFSPAPAGAVPTGRSVE